MLGRKHCSKCTRWRPIYDFSPARWDRRRGCIMLISSVCRTCERRVKRLQYRDLCYDPDRLAKRRLTWRRAKRRNRELPGSGIDLLERRLMLVLRDRVVELHKRGVSYAEMCGRIGWDMNDTSRLTRRVGLVPIVKDGQHYWTKGISASEALVMGEALSLDPIDLGL